MKVVEFQEQSAWPGFVRCIGIALCFAASLPTHLSAQAADGPYARIGILRPHDGDTVDFEAGYIRHLEWHRQANDRWTWYGWTISNGERPRSFVYATFGHSAASLDNPVPPTDDERDTIPNITPHAKFEGVGIYEFLPALSRGTGVPQPTAKVEMLTVELLPGSAQGFESILSSERSFLKEETLWYRMIAGGKTPCYVRLRPRPSLSAILESRDEQELPGTVKGLIATTTVEILNLRPTMSYGLPPLQK
jgi:hypothetical protein